MDRSLEEIVTAVVHVVCDDEEGFSCEAKEVVWIFADDVRSVKSVVVWFGIEGVWNGRESCRVGGQILQETQGVCCRNSSQALADFTSFVLLLTAKAVR